MRRRCAGILFVVVLVVLAFLPLSPAGALEARVGRADCRGEVWRGLVDGSGDSFKNLGTCVAAANHGNAYTDPRFVAASFTIEGYFGFTVRMTFTEIGMLPGDTRSYAGVADGTVTARCTTYSGVTTVRTKYVTGYGAFSAAADELGNISGTFDVFVQPASSGCLWDERAGLSVSITYERMAIIDRTGNIFVSLLG